MSNLTTKILTALLSGYRRYLSPMLAPRCRFVPSCSEYAITAIERHGPWRGSLMALKRFARCQPFGGHGLDPVPDKRS